jgi:hypothetical protein
VAQLAREGLLVKKSTAKAKVKSGKRAPSMVEMSKYAKLKREFELLKRSMTS